MRELTKSNRKPVKRLVRSYAGNPNKSDYVNGASRVRDFAPEIHNGNIYDDGLDSEVRLGSVDLEKLGNPRRIKVTITKLD